MTESSQLEDAVSRARAALAGERRALVEADEFVPDAPGLYAIHGDEGVWHQLGLGVPPDDRPLYVGKAEDSLRSRDLRTHFGDGRTGSSTVRRSFASLLREPLDLRAQPRNPAKPERFANYGLAKDGDARLTEWMRASLALAVWPKAGDVLLRDLEGVLLRAWQPPINLQGVDTPWKETLSRKRAEMAQEAREFAERGRLAD